MNNFMNSSNLSSYSEPLERLFKNYANVCIEIHLNTCFDVLFKLQIKLAY